MAQKVMWAGAIFFGGWLYAYLFVRQLLFNAKTAYPIINKMKKARPDLIAVGATRYTNISTLVCSFFLLLIGFLVIHFFRGARIHLLIAFFVGAALATVLLLSRTSPENRPMFDAFCNTYYRFVPDDELRTAMFNKNVAGIKQRLYNLDLARDMVPEFKKEEQ